MLAQSTIVFLALLPAVLGATMFTPNCTASNGTVNFVYGSGYRSTLDILWSSLFTIVACTWTILHLNVPEQRNGRDPGLWGDLKWTLKRKFQYFKWMLIAIVAPELTLALAADRLGSALDARKKFKHFADIDGIQWTLEHGFYADMGGFAIKVLLPNGKGSVPDVTFHLTSKSLLELREQGHIKKLPDIPVDHLIDQSKSDVFTKLIAAIQVFSTIIQVIVRHIKGLAISQLELAVTAFATCAAFTYLLSLHQLKGVRTVRVLDTDGEKISFEKGYKIYSKVDNRAWLSGTVEKSHFLSGGLKAISNDVFQGGRWCSPFLCIGGTIFGAVHCCGWYFGFPTLQEQMLWRIASVLTTCIPVLDLIIFFLTEKYIPDSMLTSLILFWGFILFYIISRVFIMVEAFRSLFYLPASAFVATWADNIPHLS
jgi:hypothetical protein